MKKFLAIVAVYAVLNGLLWGGQEIYYSKDTKKINEIKSFLESENSQIEQLKLSINTQEQELKNKDIYLNELEASGNIEEYNSNVSIYNTQLAKIKSDITLYDSHVVAFNSKVDEGNLLIDKSGSRWWLLPIPIGGHTKINSLK